MRFFSRIGPRLALLLAVVAVLSIATTSVIVYRSTEDDLRARLRQTTLTRLGAGVDVFSASDRLVAGTRVDDQDLPKPLRDALSRRRSVSYFDGERMWAARSFGPRGVLSVSQSAVADRQFLSDLMRQFVLAGAVAALVSILIGGLIAGATTRRLARITRVAGAAAGGDLEQRVNDPARDQVGDLARAVDSMNADLGALLERERRFAADVAHELRTPVAALVSATELLDEPRGREIAREQVARLRRLVDDLIETFRAADAQGDIEIESVPLGETVRLLLDHLGHDVVLDVEGDAWVDTERRRLSRVLDNLISNARKYGGDPITVAVRDNRMEVRDEGAGFPDWLVDRGPQRFRTESTSRGDGVGLGLSIAVALADSMGATLSFANAADGGARAVVEFRRAAAPEAA